MNVILTRTAKNSLQEIYNYKLEYSQTHADNFIDMIVAFMMENLSKFPKLGHIYNSKKSIYRVVYHKRYNIYYLIRDEQVFVLSIIDGQMQINMDMLNPDVDLQKFD